MEIMIHYLNNHKGSDLLSSWIIKEKVHLN